LLSNRLYNTGYGKADREDVND